MFRNYEEDTMNAFEARQEIIVLAPVIATALTEGSRDDLLDLREKCAPLAGAIVTQEEQDKTEKEARRAQHRSISESSSALVSMGIHTPSLSLMRKAPRTI